MFGVPWFAGWGGGYSVLAGPTGGYLVGFVLAALFIGHFTDGIVRRRRFFFLVGLMLFANFVLIHVPGLVHLRLWYHMIAGTPISIRDVLFAGMIPFMAGDVIKAVAAAGIAMTITPTWSRKD
jgi:biotin transport system substrate-specific component